MRTVIINSVGFDGGGIAKLGIEYSKLGFDVYFKNQVQPLQLRPEKLININFYSTTAELSAIISKYDRVIFLTVYDKYLDDFVATVTTLKSRFSNIEFCYLYCDRNVERLFRLLDYLKKYNIQFDRYFSINPNIVNVVPNCEYLNVNAFTFYKLKPKSVVARKPIVLTAGRVEGFKGVLSYFHNIDVNFLDNEYYYIHEGARFNFNKSGTISSPPQLLSLFDTTKSPKVPKPEFAFNEYGDLPIQHKLTIYPSYNPDDIFRWSDYYAGICCILGTKNKCKRIKSFVESRWVVDDAIENKQIAKKAKIWNSAIEYVNLEMIDVGLPVLFSRKYSEIIGFYDDSLIYDSFSDIPNKVNLLRADYDKICQRQRAFFVDKWSTVNDTILRTFTNE